MSTKKSGRVITVKVTQNHIDNGIENDCNRCPIALALLSRPNYVKAFVRNSFVRVTTSPFNVLVGDLPKRASNFIQAFDNGLSTKPFQFKLRLEA